MTILTSLSCATKFDGLVGILEGRNDNGMEVGHSVVVRRFHRKLGCDGGMLRTKITRSFVLLLKRKYKC